jgi:integrase
MASLIHEKNGTHRICFAGQDKRRRTLRLPKMPKKAAQGTFHKVEHLISYQCSKAAIDPETAAWLSTIGDELHDRIARAGLASKRSDTQTTLEKYLDAFIAGKGSMQESTRVTYGHTKRNLIDFLGANKLLREITAGDAEEFREYLVGLKLSDATCRRRVAMAKQFFARAAKKKLIAENPFSDIKGLSVRGNDARRFMVTDKMIGQLMAILPSAEWRLAVVMARYGGVRVPSELFPLSWADIDWDKQRIKITSPKTANKGKPYRFIPLWEKIRPHLEQCFEQAASGELYVFSQLRLFGQAGRDRGGQTKGTNLRTQLNRFIVKAGLSIWDKPWQNMRASRATELIHRHPAHLVNAWLGHTEAVAKEHYRNVLDSDYSDALVQESASQKLAQNAAQLESVIVGQPKFSDLLALVNPQQFPSVTNNDYACTNVQIGPV